MLGFLFLSIQLSDRCHDTGKRTRLEIGGRERREPQSAVDSVGTDLTLVEHVDCRASTCDALILVAKG